MSKHRPVFGVTLVALLLTSVLVGDAGHRATPVTGPLLGAFVGSDAAGVQHLAAFDDWLGGPPITLGRTYLPGESWAGIRGSALVLDPWTAWVRAHPHRRLALNVPMLAENEANVPDHRVARLLQHGAEGVYNRHFRVLAERLVAQGAPETIIVLGWEMNGTTYTSRCGPDPQAWAGYWRQIVATMRAVPGQRFQFDFAPVRGRHAVPWTDCYPGDDVVDIIGMDSYDQAPGRHFAEYVNQPYGLADHVRFAAARGKPVSYPEWGLFDYGDNPDYVRAMAEWIEKHPVVYHAVTDYCPHGVWRGACNPAASAAYRDTFGTG